MKTKSKEEENMKKWIAMVLAAAALFSLTVCGSKEKTADMEAVYAKFQDSLPEMYQMDEETMLNYMGIDAADCRQAVVAVASDGLRADEVWLIEAKDADALARLKALAESRLKNKEDETVQYAPEQYAVVTAAQLVTEGKNLALLVSPEAESLKSMFEAALK